MMNRTPRIADWLECWPNVPTFRSNFRHATNARQWRVTNAPDEKEPPARSAAPTIAAGKIEASFASLAVSSGEARSR